MDIRHFGTADALVDPTHDIAQNPLAIVVELGLNVVWGPIRPANWNGEEVGKMRRAAPGEVFPAGRDIDLMIMHRVQDGGRRRGHPSGIRPGKRMHDLLREHIGHPVRPAPAAMQVLRLTEVRRSSSMMPIFSVCRGSASMSSTPAKSASASATSAGPCIFGFTM